MLKRLFAVLAVSLLSATCFAAGPELRSDHPDTYTVVKGDTLWDISARFLKNPWLWPEIWQANSQIENPHLIYPGDQLSLIYLDGQPRLVRNGGRPGTVKLSPRMRDVGGQRAVAAVRLEDIRQFLEQTRVVNPAEAKDLPYVVEQGEGRLLGATDDIIYVRGLHLRPGDEVDIVRSTFTYREIPAKFPWTKNSPRGFKRTDNIGVRQVTLASLWLEKTDDLQLRKRQEVLGVELQQVARAQVIEAGDPSTLKVLKMTTEAREGDLVVAADPNPYDANFVPRAPDRVPDNMRVLAVSETNTFTGPQRLVALSRGARDGVANGQVYSLYQPAQRQRDDVKYADNDLRTVFGKGDSQFTVPPEFEGHVMIFRTFEKVSYGLVMDGVRPIRLGDVALAPR